MVTGRSIEAGRAFMRLFLEDEEFKKNLKTTERQLRAFSRSTATVGAAIAGFGTAIGTPFLLAIQQAAEAQEVFSKFDTVFGRLRASAKEFGDTLANEVGRSKTEIAEFLGGFQDLLVPIGIDPKIAAETSKQLSQLAIDLASFNNKADADVVRDLQAALTGSSEVMKKYGVIVNETAVKQQLLNEGIDPKSATETEKVFARLNIILAGTTAAQGDAARTAGSFTNQLKALVARVKDLAVDVGQQLLPAATSILTALNAGTTALTKFVNENRSLVVALAATAAGITALGTALVGIGGLTALASIGIGGLTTAVGALSTAMTFLAANPVVALVAAIGAVVLGLAAWNSATDLLAESTENVAEKVREATAEVGDFTAAIASVQPAVNKATTSLEQFQEATRLTVEQIIAQGRLLAELESTYGDLGAQTDILTGKISNLPEVLDAVSAAAERAALIDEYNASVEQLNGKFDELNETYKDLQRTLYFQENAPFLERSAEQIDATKAKLEELEQAALQINSRKVELRAELETSLAEIGEAGAATVEDTAKVIGDVAREAGRLYAQEFSRATLASGNLFEDALKRFGSAVTEAAEITEREADLRRRVFQETQALEDQIAALEIQNSTEGADRSKALLELRFEQEVRRLKAEGEFTDRVAALLKKRLELEKQAIDQAEEKESGILDGQPDELRRAVQEVVRSQGTFSGRAVAAGALLNADGQAQAERKKQTGWLERIAKEVAKDRRLRAIG